MKLPKIALLITAFVAVLAMGRAQEETILLSPFCVSSAKRSDKPPIVLKKRADFLLLQISLVNDSREEARRREEVYGTLKAMVKSVPGGSKIELFTEEFTLSASHY